MTETLTSSFTTDSITETALETVQKDTGFWIGHSGETITGNETADYLHGLHQVLETRGWAPSHKDADPEVPELDESLSTKRLILALWRYVREELDQSRGPLTLTFAKFKVADLDAGSVAYRLLDALVAAHTGTPTAQATAWAERPVRTWNEISGLLTAAAVFARTHGPR